MGHIYAATPGQNPGVARIYIYIHNYKYKYIIYNYSYIYIYTHRERQKNFNLLVKMQIPSWCFQGTGVGSNVHSSLLHLPPPRRSLVATAPEVDFSAIRCTETNGAHNLVNLPESQSFLGFCCLAIFWKNLDGNYANYGNHEPPRF